MGLDLEYINGQTPLDEDEKDGLLIPTIATRGELDEFEQQNIEDAFLWVYARNFKAEQVFSESFIRELHKRMYGKVWSWAGSFRLTNKNIGVDKWQIAIELNSLCGDALFWVKNETFTPDELALRFKHRLVSIHCFPNGNGRHSRLIADIIIEKLYEKEVFSWGANNLVQQGDERKQYIQAVRDADKGDFTALLKFARS